MKAIALRNVMIVAATLLSFAGPTVARAQETADRPLASYRDKNRLLLVFAPDAQDAAYLEQTHLWATEKSGFDERQLVVIPILADAHRVAGETPASLERKYGVEPHTFATVLVGKDGYDAYRSVRPVRADALYAAIDVMPQRRAEFRHPSPSSSTAAPSASTSARPTKPDLDHDE